MDHAERCALDMDKYNTILVHLTIKKCPRLQKCALDSRAETVSFLLLVNYTAASRVFVSKHVQVFCFPTYSVYPMHGCKL